MESTDPEQQVLSILAWASLTLLAFVLIRSVALGTAWTHLNSCRKATAVALSCWPQQDSTVPDAVTLFVRKQLEERRVRFVRMLIFILCLSYVPVTFYVMNNNNLSDMGFSGRRGSVTRNDILTPAQKFCHVTSHVALGLLSLFPWVVSTRSIDCLCCVLIFSTAVGQTPWTSSGDSYLLWTARIIAVWIGVCLSRRTPGWPVMSMGVFNAMACFMTMRQLGRPLPILQTMGVLLFELATFGGCRALESKEERQRVTLLRSDDTKALLSAATAILRSCCDVVVELDAQGAICKHGVDAASYLLRGTTLEGVPLSDLVVDDLERSAFRSRLLAPPRDEAASMAESLPVTVRDGNNSLLRVEVLWFSFRRFDGQLNFMAGLKECPEPVAPSPIPRSSPAEQLPLGRSRSIEESSVSSDSAAPDPATALLDCSQPGFPIEELSPSFCMQIGRLPRGSSMLTHLRKPDAFEDWMRRSIAAMAYEEQLPRPIKVDIKMPQGRVQAKCVLVEDGREEGMVVTVCFVHVRLRQRAGETTISARPPLPRASVAPPMQFTALSL